jgi:tyrosine-protein phosphatase SIW14
MKTTIKKTILLISLTTLSCPLFAAIPNQQTISPQIIRGGRPSNADLDLLKSQGYKTIINFENDAKVVAIEKAYAEKLGFKFISKPMNPWSTPEDAEINDILKNMADAKNFPIFIHCQHGRDRTGLVSGVYRVLNQKWKQQAAHDEMLALGFRKIFLSMDKYFWNKTK